MPIILEEQEEGGLL